MNDITRINELYAKGTPKPWSVGLLYDNTPAYEAGIASKEYASVEPLMEDFDEYLSRCDAELIVVLHNVWPKLAKLIEAVEELSGACTRSIPITQLDIHPLPKSRMQATQDVVFAYRALTSSPGSGDQDVDSK